MAKLLGTLLVEQTKSLPRQTNDNALVETKNGAVIRKHINYSHIRAHHAERSQHTNTELQPLSELSIALAPNRSRSAPQTAHTPIYRRYQTPLETLLSLEQPARYLRAGLSLATLQRMAAAISDTDAARRMQEAKRKLFDLLGCND